MTDTQHVPPEDNHRDCGFDPPLCLQVEYPRGGTKLSDEFMDGQRLGSVKCCYYWTLGASWTQIPGRWLIELWDGRRLLASQAFTLVAQVNRPSPSRLE